NRLVGMASELKNQDKIVRRSCGSGTMYLKCGSSRTMYLKCGSSRSTRLRSPASDRISEASSSRTRSHSGRPSASTRDVLPTFNCGVIALGNRRRHIPCERRRAYECMPNHGSDSSRKSQADPDPEPPEYLA